MLTEPIRQSGLVAGKLHLYYAFGIVPPWNRAALARPCWQAPVGDLGMAVLDARQRGNGPECVWARIYMVKKGIAA